MDSAFALKEYKDSLIKSSQRDPEQPQMILLNRDATSLRQMLEWDYFSLLVLRWGLHCWGPEAVVDMEVDNTTVVSGGPGGADGGGP